MLLKNKIEIESWLNKYNIENYELIKDKEYGYVVNVNGDDVDLEFANLLTIDVKFNIINGNFNCANNELNSIEGFPNFVNGYLNCSGNKIMSLRVKNKINVELDNYIKIVSGDFNCNENNLRELTGSPNVVGKDFWCCGNNLTSFDGISKTIGGIIYAYRNSLDFNGLFDLLDDSIKIKSKNVHLSGNEKLNKLQNINDLNEIKKILIIYKEKTEMIKIVEKESTNKSVKNLIKTNTDIVKVEKINKI